MYGLRRGWRQTSKHMRRRHLLLGGGGDVLIAVCRQVEIVETTTDITLPLCLNCQSVQDAMDRRALARSAGRSWT